MDETVQEGPDFDAAVHFAATGDDLRARDDADIIAALSAVFLTDVKDDAQKADFLLHCWNHKEASRHAEQAETVVAAYRRPAPPYSRDTPEGREAMWVLINILRTQKSNGRYFQSTLDVYDDGSARADFSFGGVHFQASAETLPLAVARATYIALSAQKKEEQ